MSQFLQILTLECFRKTFKCSYACKACVDWVDWDVDVVNGPETQWNLHVPWMEVTDCMWSFMHHLVTIDTLSQAWKVTCNTK